MAVNVIGVDFQNEYGVFGSVKLSKEIKAKVDFIADLHNVLRTKILKLLLLGYSYKANKARSEEEVSKRQIVKPLKSAIERYADVIRAFD